MSLPCIAIMLLNFNSNMVRLKDGRRRRKMGANRFQFQYGAIKSCDIITRLELPKPFQFQYGAIKSFIRIYITCCCPTFQFQYGAIKSLTRSESGSFRYQNFNSNMVRLKGRYWSHWKYGSHISIPIWCD